jgi:hypothetical protein
MGGACSPANDYHGAIGQSTSSFGHPGMGGLMNLYHSNNSTKYKSLHKAVKI